MTWVDYAIIVIIAISAGISLLRGFVREALSLITWILAIWVGIHYSTPLSGYLEPYLSVPSLRVGAAFVLLLVGTLVVGGLLNSLMADLVEKSGLSSTDRLLGVVFGLGRGIVIVGGLVLLAGLTAFPEDPWWQEARLIEHFEQVALQLKAWLPPEMAEKLQYD